VTFGAFFLLGLPRLKGGPAVRLDSAGFELIPIFLGKPRRFAWADVASFHIERVRRTRFVKCRLRNAPMTLASVRSQAVAGEIAMPAGLTRPPEAVLALLEDWRTRYSGAESH